MPRIIVGLGNPGPEYEGTRHNVGFAVVDALARRLRTAGWRRGFRSLWAEGTWRGQPVLLLKPQTYMNLSGEAVEQACRTLRVPPGEVLVIYDDLDLPPGHLRLRPRGSAGGHRGVASIIGALGRDDFPRLRVGIGRPPAGVDAADYVLAPFAPAEQPLMAATVQRAAEAVLAVLAAGLERAMSRYNGPTPWPAEPAAGNPRAPQRVKGRSPSPGLAGEDPRVQAQASQAVPAGGGEGGDGGDGGAARTGSPGKPGAGGDTGHSGRPRADLGAGRAGAAAAGDPAGRPGGSGADGGGGRTA